MRTKVTRNLRTNTSLFITALVGSLFLLNVTPAQAANLCVNPAGSGGCFAVIQDAINASSDGDIVQVAAGSYPENLVVNKSITLLGAQANVDPNAPSARTNPALESVIVSASITVANATVNGFQVDAPTGSGRALQAGAANDTFSYNIVDGYEAIYDQRTDGFTAAHNRLRSNYVGITVHVGNNTPATGVSITDNVITPGLAPVANARAIYMSLTINSQVNGNVGNGFVGAGFEGSGHTNLTLNGNTFNNNRKGISVFGASSFVLITNNTLSGNHSTPAGNGHGIDIKGVNLTITGNTITNNGDRGVSISNNIGITQNIGVMNNTITGNGSFGLYVDPLVLGPASANENWWGCILGPGHAGCDTISGDITLIPWYTQANGTSNSSEANLTSLVPDVGALTPAFSNGITDYVLTVPLTTTAVNFAVTADLGASWVVNGANSIVPGNNPVTITTTSADGTVSQVTNVIVQTVPLPQVSLVDPIHGLSPLPAGPTELKFTGPTIGDTVTCEFGHSPANILQTGPCTSPATYTTQPGNDYYFKVTVCNINGCTDADTSWETAPLPQAEVVNPPPATNAPAGTTQLTFTGGVPGDTITCDFGHSPTDILQTGPCTSPATYTTQPGSNYYFAVTVCNANGCSSASTTWSTAPAAACSTPVLLSAAPTQVIAGDTIALTVASFTSGALVHLGNLTLPLQSSHLDSSGAGTLAVTVPADATSSDLYLSCDTLVSSERIPVRVTASRLPPVAQAVVTHVHGARYRLDGQVSYDPNPNGRITAYRWTEHGRLLSKRSSFTRSFTPGRHHVRLQVTSNYGLKDTTTVAVKAAGPVRITVPSMRFCFNCAVLSPQARQVIRAARPYARGAHRVVIAGNTDSIGTRSYNYRLGRARAWNVHRSLLTGLRPRPHRTRTISYGETRPVASNSTAAGRARNRRVNVTIYRTAP